MSPAGSQRERWILRGLIDRDRELHPIPQLRDLWWQRYIESIVERPELVERLQQSIADGTIVDYFADA